MISVEERLDGYRRALREAGHQFDPALSRFGLYDLQTGYDAFMELWRLPERPTAIFAESDVQVLGIYRAARELGVAISAALSIVGFDDSPYAEFLNPPLTTIRQPTSEMGRMGIRPLLKPLSSLPTTTRLPVELIIRASVEALPQTSKPTARQVKSHTTSSNSSRKTS